MVLSPEQEQIRDMLRDFAREQLAPKAAEWDKTSHFPREELREATAAWAAKLAGAPRLGNWLSKQAINHVEELRGKRAAMDAVFHMHHFAHAQNDLMYGNSIAGVSGKSAAAANKKQSGEG